MKINDAEKLLYYRKLYGIIRKGDKFYGYKINGGRAYFLSFKRKCM